MNLPRGYKSKNFVADPYGCSNHLYHPKTDEIFHVDGDTYNAIVKLNQPEPEEADERGAEQVETEETGLTLSVATDEAQTVEGAEEAGQPVTHDLEELKTMATALGLELAEDATPEEIEHAVLAAVGGAK